MTQCLSKTHSTVVLHLNECVLCFTYAQLLKMMVFVCYHSTRSSFSRGVVGISKDYYTYCTTEEKDNKKERAADRDLYI